MYESCENFPFHSLTLFFNSRSVGRSGFKTLSALKMTGMKSELRAKPIVVKKITTDTLEMTGTRAVRTPVTQPTGITVKSDQAQRPVSRVDVRKRPRGPARSTRARVVSEEEEVDSTDIR